MIMPMRPEPPESAIERETAKPIGEWDADAIGEAVGQTATCISREWADYRVVGAPYGDNRAGLDRWLTERERSN